MFLKSKMSSELSIESLNRKGCVAYSFNSFNAPMRAQNGEVNYQPSIAKSEVIDNKKFKYSQTVFPAGATTVQAKIDKENNFKQAGELYRSFSKKRPG